MRDRLDHAERVPDGAPMTTVDECGCVDCCETERPVFLEGGDELAVQLRELAFGLLLHWRAPVEPSSLAVHSQTDATAVESTLGALARAGRIDRDEQGRVLGSAGLTLAHGPHALEIGGHAFRTWCAFDALGIPAALEADARVETACGVCGRSITVELRDGRATVAGPAILWLAAGGADMRADFCTPTVLLCTEAHAHVWAEREAGRGRALGLNAEIDSRSSPPARRSIAAATRTRFRSTVSVVPSPAGRHG